MKFPLYDVHMNSSTKSVAQWIQLRRHLYHPAVLEIISTIIVSRSCCGILSSNINSPPPFRDACNLIAVHFITVKSSVMVNEHHCDGPATKNVYRYAWPTWLAQAGMPHFQLPLRNMLPICSHRLDYADSQEAIERGRKLCTIQPKTAPLAKTRNLEIFKLLMDYSLVFR